MTTYRGSECSVIDFAAAPALTCCCLPFTLRNTGCRIAIVARVMSAAAYSTRFYGDSTLLCCILASCLSHLFDQRALDCFACRMLQSLSTMWADLLQQVSIHFPDLALVSLVNDVDTSNLMPIHSCSSHRIAGKRYNQKVC